MRLPEIPEAQNGDELLFIVNGIDYSVIPLVYSTQISVSNLSMPLELGVCAKSFIASTTA